MHPGSFPAEGSEEGAAREMLLKKCSRMRVVPKGDQQRKSPLLLLGFLSKVSDYVKELLSGTESQNGQDLFPSKKIFGK